MKKTRLTIPVFREILQETLNGERIRLNKMENKEDLDYDEYLKLISRVQTLESMYHFLINANKK